MSTEEVVVTRLRLFALGLYSFCGICSTYWTRSIGLSDKEEELLLTISTYIALTVLLCHTKARKLTEFGHILRKGEDCLEKEIMQGTTGLQACHKPALQA